jgi:hypothetical protein
MQEQSETKQKAEKSFESFKILVRELSSLDEVQRACAFFIRGKKIQLTEELDFYASESAKNIKRFLDIVDEALERFNIDGPGDIDCGHEKCERAATESSISLLLAADGDWNFVKVLISRMMWVTIPFTGDVYTGFEYLRRAKHHLKEYNDYKKQSSNAG